MSLLTIVQAVTDEIGLRAPSSVVGSNDQAARQLFRIVNRSGKNLAMKPWVQLQREYTFSTVNGTAYYDLPADYGYIVDRTVWDRDNFWAIRGGLSPQEWQIRKSGLNLSMQSRKGFRLKALPTGPAAAKFYLDPTPDADDDLVFEYVSTYWAVNGAGTVWKVAMTADDDTVVGFPEALVEMDVIWRFKKAKGLEYAEDFDEFEKQRDMRFAAAIVPQTLNMGASRARLPLPRIPESGFG